MKTLKILLLPALCLAFMATSFGQLKVDMDGKVGAGTATPEQPMDVNGTLQVRGQFILHGKDAGASEAGILAGFQRQAAGSSAIRFYNGSGGFNDWATTFGVDPSGGGGLFHKGGGALGIVTQGTQNIQMGVNGVSEIFVEGATGNVGVNTESPDQTFSVNGNASKNGGGDWLAFSDRRLKKEIKPFEDGLDQVLALNPVTFKYNGEAGITNTEKEYVGVIAQEIQKVAPYTVEPVLHKEYTSTLKEGDFLPTRELKSEKEYLTVDATAVRYMLVNAVKEQQQMIEEKDARINELEERLNRIEAILGNQTIDNGSSQTIDLGQSTKGMLLQNEPNPFTSTTTINYMLPEDATNASVSVMDTNGRMLKNIALTDGGAGQVIINASELNSGIYTYSLIIDGRIMDTKKMVLTK